MYFPMSVSSHGMISVSFFIVCFCFSSFFRVCDSYGEGYWTELGFNQVPIMSTTYDPAHDYYKMHNIDNVWFNQFVRHIRTLDVRYYQLQEKKLQFSGRDFKGRERSGFAWEFYFIIMQNNLDSPVQIVGQRQRLLDPSRSVDWRTKGQVHRLSMDPVKLGVEDVTKLTSTKLPLPGGGFLTTEIPLPKGGFDEISYCKYAEGTRPTCDSRPNVHLFVSTYMLGYTGVGISNGFYFKNPLRGTDGFFLAVSGSNPTQCEPGTWNTCKNSESCTYREAQIGESHAMWVHRQRTQYYDDIYVFDQYSLHGGCYPCKAAFNFVRHYNSQTINMNTGDRNNGISLPFYCPGGVKPPINCPTGTEAIMFDNGKATNCSCKVGSYNALGDINLASYHGDLTKIVMTDVRDHVQCVSCPAGFKCVGGKPIICEQGTYSRAGASSCLQCTTGACNNGRLRPICMEGSTRDSDYCVSCSECRGLGNNDPNAVECMGNIQMGERNEANQRRGGGFRNGGGATVPINYLPPIEFFLGNVTGK